MGLKTVAAMVLLVLLELTIWVFLTVDTMHFAKHTPLFVGITVGLGVHVLMMLCFGIALVVRQMRAQREKASDYQSEQLLDRYDQDFSRADAINHGSSLQKKKSSLLAKILHGVCGFVNLILLLVLLAVFGMYLWVLNTTQPQLTGTINLPGLHKDVSIMRETNGMVHVTAENEHDLLFGQGVAEAQNRLWQMEFQRRVGFGTLSEIVGSQTVKVDKTLRLLGVGHAATTAYAKLPKFAKKAVDSYTAGINAYLATNPPLPLEFAFLGAAPKNWTGPDVLVWGKMLSQDLSLNLNDEINRWTYLSNGVTKSRLDDLYAPPGDRAFIVPKEEVKQFNEDITKKYDCDKVQCTGQKDTAAFIPPTKKGNTNEDEDEEMMLGMEEAWVAVHEIDNKAVRDMLMDILPGLFGKHGHDTARASNNWVVHGKHTASGKPILCNDPHLGFTSPAIWMFVHLECTACDINVIGTALPGVPGVIIGRNDHLAWGITNSGADVQDLYVLDETNGGKSYKHNGKDVDYVVRKETIKVKGAEDIDITIKDSIYGPVITDMFELMSKKGAYIKKPIALRWNALDEEDTSVAAIAGLMKARNLKEFQASLAYFQTPIENIVYADVEGNIAFFSHGHIPVRVKGHTGLYPVPGTGEYDWVEYMPIKYIPHMINPERGYVITANNREIEPGAEYIFDYNLPYWPVYMRADRINMLIGDMIRNGTKIDRDLMIKVQTDVHTLAWNDFQQFLSSAYLGKDALGLLTSEAAEWRTKLLQEFDGVLSKETTHGAIFEYWYYQLCFLPTIDSAKHHHWNMPNYLQNALKNGDSSCGSGKDCRKFAARALNYAVGNWTESGFSSWGEAHPYKFAHELLGKIPVIGSMFNREAPAAGSGYTIAAATWGFPGALAEMTDFHMYATHGASFREVVDFSDLNGRSKFIFPPGQQGSPISMNYDNYLYDFYAKDLYIDMSTADPTKVENGTGAAIALHVLTLKP